MRKVLSLPRFNKSRLSCFLHPRFLFFTVLAIILLLSTPYVYSAEVTLAWDANTESDLAGYKIYYRTSTENYDHYIDVGNETRCTISNLQERKTYCFVATAYDLNGNESGFSDEVTYTVPEGDTGNHAPLARDGILTVTENMTGNGTASASDMDGDILTYNIVTNGTGGTATITNSTTGAYRYIPHPNVTGTDSFTFKAHDGAFESNVATIAVTILPKFLSLPPMEIGEAYIDHNWRRITFSEPFVDPVIVAKPLSSNDKDPSVVRIRNIDSSGFEMCVQEWDYLGGRHVTETVGYMVMERGRYILADETMIEAGTFVTDKTRSFGPKPFSRPFQTVPVVIAAVCSANEGDAVTTRIRNITTAGFEFRMQEQEGNAQVHTAETISYIAWEPSAGTIDGLMFEVDKTRNKVNHGFYTISYREPFPNIPVLLADMQTSDSHDTANVRWKNKDSYGVQVQVDEEQSRDKETRHTTEVVGYMLFDTTDSAEGTGPTEYVVLR